MMQSVHVATPTQWDAFDRESGVVQVVVVNTQGAHSKIKFDETALRRFRQSNSK